MFSRLRCPLIYNNSWGWVPWFQNLHLQGPGKLRNIMMGGPGQMGGPSNIMGGPAPPNETMMTTKFEDSLNDSSRDSVDFHVQLLQDSIVSIKRPIQLTCQQRFRGTSRVSSRTVCCSLRITSRGLDSSTRTYLHSHSSLHG